MIKPPTKPEIITILETAVVLDVYGAADALKKVNALYEALYDLEAEVKAIRKSLKKIKKAL